MKQMKGITVALLMGLLLVGGCATLGPVYQRVATIPEGTGLVYIYRPSSFVGGGVAYDVKVGETVVTTLHNGGYYPYFTEGPHVYHIRLSQSIRTVLESDMSSIEGYDGSKANVLLKLLYILAGSVPYKPNISLLGKRTGLHANTVVKYLHYLERARILSFLWAPNKGMSLLQKPDKVYLDNSNLAYAIRGPEVNIGSIRELFFHNQVKQVATLIYTPTADFLVDEKYLVEIGGPGKSVSKDKDMYVVRDGIDHGAEKVIPLWLFGFLY